MERREILSFVLPVAGLSFSIPEMVRLLQEHTALADCIARAQAEQLSCGQQETLLLILMGVLTVVFVGRLLFLTREHLR